MFYESCKNTNEAFLLAHKYFKLILRQYTNIICNNYFIFVSYSVIYNMYTRYYAYSREEE
jgi:hypothetical protein